MIGPQIGVQQHWNVLENVIINVVDAIAPLEEYTVSATSTLKVNAHCKNKINLKKRLLKQNRLNYSTETHSRIKLLNKEVTANCCQINV